MRLLAQEPVGDRRLGSQVLLLEKFLDIVSNFSIQGSRYFSKHACRDLAYLSLQILFDSLGVQVPPPLSSW